MYVQQMLRLTTQDHIIQLPKDSMEKFQIHGGLINMITYQTDRLISKRQDQRSGSKQKVRLPILWLVLELVELPQV